MYWVFEALLAIDNSIIFFLCTIHLPANIRYIRRRLYYCLSLVMPQIPNTHIHYFNRFNNWGDSGSSPLRIIGDGVCVNPSFLKMCIPFEVGVENSSYCWFALHWPPTYHIFANEHTIGKIQEYYYSPSLVLSELQETTLSCPPRQYLEIELNWGTRYTSFSR